MIKTHNATSFREINRNCDDPSFKPYQVQDIKKNVQTFFFDQLKKEIGFEQLPSNAKFYKQVDEAKKEEQKRKEQCLDLKFFFEEKNKKDLEDIQGKNSKYLSYLYYYFELPEIVEWLRKLNEGCTNITCSLISAKASTGACEKMFLRGKPLNDLLRATVVAADFFIFFENLNDFCKKTGFDYWIDDEENATGYKVLKIYIYKVNKSYKNKIVPVEIQLQTSQHYNFLKGSKSHQSYVIERIQQFVKCQEVYLEHNPHVPMEDFIKPFLASGAILQSDWDKLNIRGDFEGGFKEKNEKGSFSVPKANSCEISKDGTPTDLEFCNARKDKNLKIINGNLFLTEWAYHWTEQSFSTKQNYLINVEAYIGENIWIAIGRDKEVWIGPNEGSKLTSWTIMLGQIMMIRTGMYYRYWKTDRRYKAPKDKKVNLEIKIQNREINVIIDGKEDSKKVAYNYDTFRIGILSWNAQEHTFIKNLRIKNL